MDICNNIYEYRRRCSLPVPVGSVIIGGDNPIVIQSMGNVPTTDVEGAVKQALSIEASGANIVRFTTQGVREAENLGVISTILNLRMSNVALVADVHFKAEPAFIAAAMVDKVRINPGNFSEEGNLRDKFGQLIAICKENNTSIRVGVNHGSLSKRMVERYGDTVEGMVQSALEYLLIAKELDFSRVVVSLKSSNTIIMVNAYRRMCDVMNEMGMSYPLHLGVTEAGNGMEGRSRSAVGIGALLADGIGDTIRVSLTEEPSHEAPFAKILIDYINNDIRSSEGVDGFIPTINTGFVEVPFVVGEDNIEYDEVCYNTLHSTTMTKSVVVVNEPSFYRRRAVVEWLTRNVCKKIVVKREYSLPREEFIAAVGVDFGAMLLDGYMSGVWITNSAMEVSEYEEITLDLLQASRRKITSPEYISCPSCGRTLYDIEGVLGEVKRRTKGLKNIKIAVMGCIVNGPGEMADADYGYVGAGRGKVTLYRHGKVFKQNIDESVAIDELVKLLTDNGEFVR